MSGGGEGDLTDHRQGTGFPQLTVSRVVVTGVIISIFKRCVCFLGLLTINSQGARFLVLWFGSTLKSPGQAPNQRIKQRECWASSPEASHSSVQM